MTGGTGVRRRWRPDRLWAVRAGHVAMWVALLLGAVGGVATLLAPAAGGSAPPARPPPAAPDVAAGGWAELYVASWLSAGGEAGARSLSRFYPQPVDLGRVPAGGRYASRTAAVEIRELAAGYWAVTVAAEVLEAAPGRLQATGIADGSGEPAAYRPVGVRYFTVGILAEAGRFVATGLPSEVAGPAGLELPASPLGAPTRGGTRDPAVTDTVDGFLEALLTDTGDLTRYVAPGATVAPVRPAPYATVAVAGLSAADDGAGRLLVRARVMGTDAAGDPAGVSDYVVRLSRRDGRWEVVELLPALPLADVDRGGDTS